MLHAIRGLLFAALAVALGLGLGSLRAEAQAAGKEAKKAGDPVKITTVDGVDLHGLFFPSPKKDAPTVILLHPLGETGMTKSYTSLAESLQPNCSVLCFDFRGHGKSKDIDPALFRKYPGNSRVKGDFKKTTIEYGDFPKDYYPVICNDIAAVKGYLDRRNDANNCNSSNLILIGAETGATLGAIWLNSEWSRYKLQLNAMGIPQLNMTPEGRNTVAAIWLSISTKLGSKRSVTLEPVLDKAARENATPMAFVVGDLDSVGKERAEKLVKYIKGKTKDTRHKGTFVAALKATKLTGVSLLEQKSLGLPDAIAKTLDDMASYKANEWTELDYRKSQYVWQQLGSPPVIAKPTGEMNAVFDTYEKFMR